MDRDPQVAVVVAEATTTLNVVSLQFETDDTSTAANSSLTTSDNNDCGGHHGCEFGQGAYGGSCA